MSPPRVSLSPSVDEGGSEEKVRQSVYAQHGVWLTMGIGSGVEGQACPCVIRDEVDGRKGQPCPRAEESWPGTGTGHITEHQGPVPLSGEVWVCARAPRGTY